MKPPKSVKGPINPLNCSEGAAAAKRFTMLVKRVLSVPKEEIDRRVKQWKASRKGEPIKEG